MARSTDTIIDRCQVSVYRVPTETAESDGTLEWDSTTMVLVELFTAGGLTGLGFTYASQSTASLIRETLLKIGHGESHRSFSASLYSRCRRTH